MGQSWVTTVHLVTEGGGDAPERWLAATIKKTHEEEVLGTMAASMELRMDHLPSDPLLHILSFLGFRDLIQYVSDSRPLQSTRQRVTVNGVVFLKNEVNKVQNASRLAAAA